MVEDPSPPADIAHPATPVDVPHPATVPAAPRPRSSLCGKAIGSALQPCGPIESYIHESWDAERSAAVLAEVGFGKEVHRLFKNVKDGKMRNPATDRRENSYVGLSRRED